MSTGKRTFFFLIAVAFCFGIFHVATAATKTKSLVTVRIFGDTNKNGKWDTGEKFLSGIAVTFRHTWTDLIFSDKNDKLRPEKNDAHYDRKTDKTWTIKVAPRRGILYAKIKNLADFTYMTETEEKFWIKHDGYKEEWRIWVIKAPEVEQATKESTPKKETKKTTTTKTGTTKKAAPAKKVEEKKAPTLTKKELAKPKPKAEKKTTISLQSKSLASAPKKEAPTNNSNLDCQILEYRRCTFVKRNGFRGYADDLACEGIIKKKASCDEYSCERDITRAEVVGMGLKIQRKEIPKDYECQYKYSDIKPGMPSWICRAAELGFERKVITSTNKNFFPDRKESRAAAFKVLMNSVCMKTVKDVSWFSGDPKVQKWQKEVIETAQKYGLTKRSDSEFQPDRPIYRQELFLVASKVMDWAQKTGGCNQKNICK